jgi:hypothetical protein
MVSRFILHPLSAKILSDIPDLNHICYSVPDLQILADIDYPCKDHRNMSPTLASSRSPQSAWLCSDGRGLGIHRANFALALVSSLRLPMVSCGLRKNK